jgi:hypothetical protein
VGSSKSTLLASLILVGMLGVPCLRAEAGELPRLLPETLHLDNVGDDSPNGGGGGVSTFGIGLIVGDPTGFTAKLMFAGFNGIQIHLGWGLAGRGRFVLIVDYLFHFVDLIPPARGAGRFAPYIGIGGHLGLRSGNEKNNNDDVFLGVRVPFGLAFILSSVPVEIFAEVALGLGLIPGTELLIDGGIGARYYF